MKAVQLVAQGKLALADLPVPQPSEDEVLLRVRACGLCETDILEYLLVDSIPFVHLPLVMGHEFAGEIVTLGAGVSGWQVGDRVVCESVVSCGRCAMCEAGRSNLCLQRRDLGQTGDGGFAEYVAVPARNLHPLPPSLSFEEGALVEPLACVLWGLKRARLQPEDDVLIIGDGFFGLMFAQLARALGAGRIVLLGHHEERMAKASEYGADVAVDERAPEASQEALRLGGGIGAPVVIDTVGSEKSLGQAISLGGVGARVALFGFSTRAAPVDPVLMVLKEQDILPVLASPSVWPEVLRLLAEGKVCPQALISRVVLLEELEEAFALKAVRRPDIYKIVVKP
ncbi:MAG TPA: alcohol dehydrogenase catalytic domain-containing protein [Chloroflexota bacterium]|nr:alcohol dehydrogenase catalytic domain-containing protein [Chloroflexota bacterium]